jgi:hypothetical protein
MKLNFFKPSSPYYPFRWFFVFTLLVVSLLVYANTTGWRLMSFSGQQQWNAKGPGYHK